MQKTGRRWLLASSLAALLVAGSAVTASADHYWGNYHWARTSNPFTVKLGDNLSSNWKSYLNTASSDWSKSTVLDTTVVSGQSNKRCAATSGRVEVCNSTYGNNGWLGIASIWASGSHITASTVKLNDTYFNTATYNTPAWRNLVMCQEVGHAFGLAHQDENFDNANLGTCMDYTSDPSTNQHPNKHDYDLLVDIYSHLDNTTTISSVELPADASGEVEEGPAAWGIMVRQSKDGRLATFEKVYGNGIKRITHVFFVEGAPQGNREHRHHDH